MISPLILSLILTLPDYSHEWKRQSFPNSEKFPIVKLNTDDQVEFDSDSDAGVLIYKTNIDVHKFSIIHWEWKVSSPLLLSNLYSKQGDDYSARLYVFFDLSLEELNWKDRISLILARKIYGNNVPSMALCYVWNQNSPVNTIASSPYTSSVKLIVVSDSPGQNNLISIERNVLLDFKNAFGKDAPNISGIAIGVDTDNTHSRTKAWFGQIKFLSQ